MQDDLFNMDELVLHDNDELMSDTKINQDNTNNIIVYSRDWTIETVVNQIKQGNIDLDPAYQRRNAWNDKKKSQLIESYLMGYPVPEIVLAEHPRERKKFVVIDGKQRLLTLCGFIKPEEYDTWKKPILSGLQDLEHLNGTSYSQFETDPSFSENLRLLANSDVRCTVISNVENDDVLYDIFHRLNAGATPLTMQELRQVLYAGPLPKYLLDYTTSLSEFHKVLNLTEPDNRLKDVETITRNLAFNLRYTTYTGNLKKFLDEFTDFSNKNWGREKQNIENFLDKANKTIKHFIDLNSGDQKIWGRKYDTNKGKLETRFNTVLFEVQLHFALNSKKINEINISDYFEKIKILFNNNDFINSISSSTKNISAYKTRYQLYSDFFNDLTGEGIPSPWI